MIKIKNSRKESQTIIKDHLDDEIFKTDQIDGKLEFNGSNGTEFKIIFKEGDYY